MLARAVLPLLLATAVATPVAAQDWRTVDVSRQLRDSSAHDVRIRYGAGSLEVRPTDGRMLFTMHLRYDEGAVTPVHEYDAIARQVTLGLSDASFKVGRGLGKESHGELQVGLSPDVPIALDVELGAAEAQLDLGGLSLREVTFETGASDTKLGFAAPNRTTMRRLDVSSGAANIEVTGLANARVREVRVKSGVGNVELDFDGNLSEDVDIEAEMALGRIAVTIPRDAGVRVELSRFLAGFDHPGLIKRDGAWYSENWDRAGRRITLDVRTVFGSVAVKRAAF